MRRLAIFVAASVFIGGCCAVFVSVPATATGRSTASLTGHVATQSAATVAAVLAGLPTSPAIAAGYRYADFAIPPVSRKSERGCGKRERVLLASASVQPTITSGCTLVGGVWLVNNGSRTVHGAAGVDVVPLVSEKSVWTQGGFGWTNRLRRAFQAWQQGPARECALGSSGATSECAFVLEARGTGGRGASVTDVMSQSQWKLTCPQVSGIVGTLASWGLAIDPAVRARIQARECQNQSVQVAQLNPQRALARTEVGNPFLAPGTDARIWPTDAVLQAQPGPTIPASLFGLHVPSPAQSAPTVPFGWLRLWDSKTGWEPLEQNKGIFYWKTLDDELAYAEANNLKVLYVFGDTPAWAGPSPAFPPTNASDFQQFVQAVVSRYGNRIAAYEVWNEPNLNAPMSQQVANLVDMTKILADTVHGAGLSSQILTPSTTMRTDTVIALYFAQYLSKLAAIGWPVDGFAFHTYPRAGGGPAQRVWAIAQFKQLLALAGAPNKPIWDTEINYGLGGLGDPKRAITGQDAQGYLSQTFLDSIRLGVQYVDWYLWFPTTYDLLGIQLNSSTPDTIAAWQWTYQQVVNASLTACGQAGDAVVCGFTRPGSRYVIAYSSTGVATKVAVPAGLSTSCDMSGICQPVVGGTVTVGIRPIRVS